MGCDLQAYLEYRGNQGARFLLFSEVIFERDYEFFNLLSLKVRGDKILENHLFEERGLPLDTSMAILDEYEGVEGENESCSWLYKSELEKVLIHVKSNTNKLVLRAILAAMDILNADDPRRSRLVYWLM